MPSSSSSSNPFHCSLTSNPLPTSSPSSSSPAPHLLPVSSAFTAPSSSPSSSAPNLRRQPQRLMAGPAAAGGGKGAAGGGIKVGGSGGPAFVGQVFTMLDPSGNGLMAVTKRFDLPHFIADRTPTWFKRILSPLKKSDNDPVFRFFMDLNDSVSYVKRLNVPSGMVGACRLDVAYEHFKEKPHMFQFVPNEKQVKAANKLLKSIPQRGKRKKLAGVPVFSAQNLNIAVATNDGIRWYSPYFFDKNLLDNILEGSMDQHFHSMIQNRHIQRRRDIVDDSLTSEILEESADGLLEPPEMQELMNEIGPAGIPLSVVTKAAEIQCLDVVDKLLLGNKWLRRATGIQPHFPYVVDSFEERTAVSVDRIATSSNTSTASKDADCCPVDQQSQTLEPNIDSGNHRKQNSRDHGQSHFPFSNLLSNIWPGHDRMFKRQENDSRSRRYDSSMNNDFQENPLLPQITMVGISMSEGGQMSKANLKKTMDDLTKELEQAGEKTVFGGEKDPLFVANVGDYSRITKFSST
ncbi:hypothetical protein CFC21_046700 [Triticum aestivum]|uniref:Uncharacterized protein n=2 Tax=Triticum aestivum TaxID=4565 RepID=A0A3B6GP20_WHEAT|nr:uncharacterized protein LOC123077839 [Triticum aestivum]KAF7035919.1 hypothetical protein CFC21_046700 [Triticum aestivum]